MKAKKLKLLLTSLGLITYVLTFVLRVEGVVLCFGQDGHVELETASPSLTCEVPAPIEALSTSISTPQGRWISDHCGPCTDVPLMLMGPDTIASLRSFTIPAPKETVTAQLITATQLNSYLLPIIDKAPSDNLQQFSAGNSPLVTLRTVILLI